MKPLEDHCVVGLSGPFSWRTGKGIKLKLISTTNVYGPLKVCEKIKLLSQQNEKKRQFMSYIMMLPNTSRIAPIIFVHLRIVIIFSSLVIHIANYFSRLELTIQASDASVAVELIKRKFMCIKCKKHNLFQFAWNFLLMMFQS